MKVLAEEGAEKRSRRLDKSDCRLRSSRLPENPRCLSYRLVETLGRDLDRVLDALRVLACDPACSERHRAEDTELSTETMSVIPTVQLPLVFALGAAFFLARSFS
jgi:hypothetical protein